MTEKDFDVQGFARDIHQLLVLSTLRDDSKRMRYRTLFSARDSRKARVSGEKWPASIRVGGTPARPSHPGGMPAP
jgi:hypothetical protein